MFPAGDERRDGRTVGAARFVVIETERVTGAVAGVDGPNGVMVM